MKNSTDFSAMNTLRVLHVITDVNIGGAGTHLINYLDCFDRNGFVAEVVAPVGSRLIPEIKKRGVECLEAPHIGGKSFSLRGIATMHRIIKQRKPDIVHTHAALSARIAGRLAKCAVIHTRHSVFEPPKLLRRFPFKQTNGMLNGWLSDAIIAVSPAAKENLMQTGVKEAKIVSIYNGAKTVLSLSDDERDDVRRRYGIPNGAFVVAQIARLTEVKGHSYVLDAAKAWASMGYDDIVTVMAGDGELMEPLRKRIVDDRIRNVILAGFVGNIEEIENIMDVQVSASFGTEATSMAMLEGFSLGVPAVVSDFGGNPYMVTDGVNGLVVPQRDSVALCEAVLRIKNDEGLRRRLSDGALTSYRERFTAKMMVRQMEEVYLKSVRGQLWTKRQTKKEKSS